jgi:SpoVK/Ycf46/Vps4 family AAA+-type ATPase
LHVAPANTCRLRAQTKSIEQAERARKELGSAEDKLQQYSKEARSEALKKIDAADRKVEEGASKAKSGISSWFGGK